MERDREADKQTCRHEAERMSRCFVSASNNADVKHPEPHKPNHACVLKTRHFVDIENETISVGI